MINRAVVRGDQLLNADHRKSLLQIKFKFGISKNGLVPEDLDRAEDFVGGVCRVHFLATDVDDGFKRV